MRLRHPDKIFKPASIAVVGAGERAGGIGQALMRHLVEGGFPGPIWPINPNRASIPGRTAFAALADLEQTPDLAVIAPIGEVCGG